jgi:TatA/E family protein of Tat protein translocase
MVLFISSGEIFIILLAILIFFGADKIPEFARMMGKGVREFKKATDDIKREFEGSSSGIMNDIKSIRDDMTGAFTKEIAEPMQKTANEAEKTFDEYRDQYNTDYYYDNPNDMGYHGNEYQEDTHTSESVAEKTVEIPAETSDSLQPENEPAPETKPKPKPKPKSKPKPKPIADTTKPDEA